MASARDLPDGPEANLDGLLDSEHFRHRLNVPTRFPRYRFSTVLLIAAQRLTASPVRGFYAWKQDGRSLKQVQHGITILAQVPYKGQDPEPDAPTRVGFPVVFVFVRLLPARRARRRWTPGCSYQPNVA